jgi:hypothetical protein
MSFLLLLMSSTKLEKRAEQVVPISEGGGERVGAGGEMAQTMYAHMNK